MHSPFPTAPLRTARDSFDVKQLASGQADGQLQYGYSHLAYRVAVVHPTTCRASPCERLSRSPWCDVTRTTTITTPSPWDSRPVGNPVFRHRGTYRERRRLPTHILECTHCASSIRTGRTTSESLTRGFRRHRRSDVLPKSVRFRHWTLGFRQFGFSHIAQALQSNSAHVFSCPLLYQQAVVPSPFRVQVSRSPRSHCPELRPPLVAIHSARDTAHTFALIRLLATRAFCHTGTLLGMIAHPQSLTPALLELDSVRSSVRLRVCHKTQTPPAPARLSHKNPLDKAAQKL